MRYLPHVISFLFFFLLALVAVGSIQFFIFLRCVAAIICIAVCALIAEASVLRRKVKTYQYVPKMSVQADELIRKGDMCIVDPVNRTVGRAPH